MSTPHLTFSLYTPDDGDGLAKYHVSAQNDSFSSTTNFWAYAEQFETFASSIKGFPVKAHDSALLQLGSPNIGKCTIEFVCIDGSGHVAVWATIESDSPLHPSDRHQRAELALRVEPASIDLFYLELLSLASGTSSKATLHGSTP